MAARAGGRALVASVAAGDVLRTLGLDSPRAADQSMAYPIDLGLVELRAQPAQRESATGAHHDLDSHPGPGSRPGTGPEPERAVPFVAHVLAAGAMWAPAGRRAAGMRNDPRELTVVMNAAWLGSLRLGPRAHLNDGLLDVTHGRFRLGELWEARRRAVAGDHLPHPGLVVRRVDHWEIPFGRPRHVWVDGRSAGRAWGLAVRLIPDALTVVV